MKRSEAFPSNYLSKEDCTPPITATIAGLSRKTLKSDEGDETKTVMQFREEQYKPLILNNVNWLACEDAFGEESNDWIGKKIELFSDPTVMFGNKRVGGIRIRIIQGGAKSALPVGNGTVISPKELWEQFCVEHNITKPDVLAALGTELVTEWIKAHADNGATLDQAMTLILASKQATEQAF